ncbi:MAG: Asp-tRNA(Asn)/Glu-tRNA(Gln) amidotransferase subunit GatC, partial [Gammaproteobacteria bacterium]
MDKKTVSTIAYLSRLALNEENGEKITQDLENIIKFVDQLENANTQNIEPLASPLEKTA